MRIKEKTNHKHTLPPEKTNKARDVGLISEEEKAIKTNAPHFHQKALIQ